MSKIDRRTLLKGYAALLASVGISNSQQSQAKQNNRAPENFVLVHGTWHGGWVWRDVRNYLEDRGHRVFTPTLTGCGEREHLSSPDIGLDTHIQDILNVIEFEELSNIVLVGHSF